MSELKIKFTGEKSQKALEAIYYYIVDGGGEDAFTQILEDNDIDVKKFSFDNNKKEIEFNI